MVIEYNGELSSFEADIQQIDANMFGANIEAHMDVIDGTFAEKALSLGVSHLRYPGGSTTEKYFDMRWPDNPAQTHKGTMVGLSEFLTFCEENGIQPVLTIPTKRYVDKLATGEQHLERFLERLAAGEFGSVDGLKLEVGNEFYVNDARTSDFFPGVQITAEEYAEIAISFSALAKEYFPEAELAVQAGFWRGENTTIIDAFVEADALDNVDTVVMHPYPRNDAEIETKLNYVKTLTDEWNDAAGREINTYLSEWNVKSTSQSREDALGRDFEPSAYDWGLKQASTMVEFFAEAVKLGVDSASVWTIQQETRASLTSPEGSNYMKVGGETFRMMSESLIGTQHLDIKDQTANEALFLTAFESEAKIVVFVSLRQELDAKQTVEVELKDLPFAVQHGWTETLSVTNGIDSPFGTDVSTRNVFSDEHQEVVNLQLDFSTGYELIKIELVKSGALTSDVSFLGGTADERLSGGIGSDLIRGRGGDDFLSGGAGSDHLIGGSGADVLFGGGGRDVIWGSAGDDFLFGGKGRDILKGGDGRDIFAFESGDATDRVLDFEAGVDRLYIHRHTFEELEQTVEGNNLIVFSDEVRIVLRGLVAPLEASDFITDQVWDFSRIDSDGDDITHSNLFRPLDFAPGHENVIGGNTDDWLLGSNKSNTIKGFDGNDTLNGGGGSNLIRGGDGDDVLVGGRFTDRLFGDDGDDDLVGGDGDDSLFGGAGADTLRGGGGDADIAIYIGSDDGVDIRLGFGLGQGGFAAGDTFEGIEHLMGSRFDDMLLGNDAENLFFGSDGNDVLRGWDGSDTLHGGSGDDSIYGGGKADVITGGAGDDRVDGGNGRDMIYLGRGDDVFVDIAQGGYYGVDTIFAGAGDDQVLGGGGGDILKGQWGDDYLFGGEGSDTIRGGEGNDRIEGGADDDVLSGGVGSDTFIFSSNSGLDLVRDFQVGRDLLHFDVRELTYTDLGFSSDANGDLIISYGNENRLFLEGVTEVLTVTDFSFITPTNSPHQSESADNFGQTSVLKWDKEALSEVCIMPVLYDAA